MTNPTPRRPAPMPDLVLFTITLVLVAIGVVAVYSSSYPESAKEAALAAKAAAAAPAAPQTAPATGDDTAPTLAQIERTVEVQRKMLRKQLKWVLIGLACLLCGLAVPYDWLRSRGFAWTFLSVAVGLLVLVLFFGTDNGRVCKRWLSVGSLTFQPSEFAKFALVAFLANRAAEVGDRIRHRREFTTQMAVVALVAGLVVIEPHLGATIVILTAALAVLLVAGADQRHLAAVVLLGVTAGLGSAALNPYQAERLKVWLHPERYEVAGYHAVHCNTALARGGIAGRGLGRSIEKFGYLPECSTDSVLAIVGEESGFLGTALLLLLFVGLAERGLRVAWRCPDPFGRLLAVGITSVLFGQAMVNFGVTSGLLPQTGVGLPFISYGGSALCCFLGAVGLLLNISRQCRPLTFRERRAELNWRRGASRHAW